MTGQNAPANMLVRPDIEKAAEQAAKAKAAAWRRRWLLNRVQSEEVLDRVGKLGPESVRAELWADEDGQFKLPLE
jgi:hypothetical protein